MGLDSAGRLHELPEQDLCYEGRFFTRQYIPGQRNKDECARCCNILPFWLTRPLVAAILDSENSREILINYSYFTVQVGHVRTQVDEML